MTQFKPLFLKALLLGLCAALMVQTPAMAAMRIKDLARVEGVRGNQLYGLGLVVGLDDTGDQDLSVTRQMMTNLVNRLGLNVPSTDLAAGNVAAVMVTAELPPFARPGDRLDITVSSIGDAESLDGGMLLQTPLQAANSKVYAVAQGAVSLGGVDRTKRQQRGSGNVRTTANLPGGAFVERAVPMEVAKNQTVSVVLHRADFTTAERVENAINQAFGPDTAMAVDMGTIVTLMPEAYKGRAVKFIAHLEALEISADARAQIVINERTGTIVIGGDMDIQPVTIAHGTLSITIEEDSAKVDKAPDLAAMGADEISDSATATNAMDKEKEPRHEYLMSLRSNGKRAVSTRELVELLNQLGVTPKDVVAILQALKAAGALNADIKMM